MTTENSREDPTPQKNIDIPPVYNEITKDISMLIRTEFDNKVVSKITDQDDIMTYMNHYFAVMKGSSTISYCEIMYQDNKPYRFSIRNKGDFTNLLENCSIMDRRKSLPLSNFWLSHPDRRVIRNLVFEPYTLHPPQIHHNDLNIFTGFKAKILENRDKIDYQKIQKLLNHIKVVWCDNNVIIYEYVIKWLAQLMQYPNIRSGVCLVIKSIMHGAGKSMIIDFLRDYVLGMEYCRTVSNLDTIFGKFNSLEEKMLLTCCEEVGSQGAMYKKSDMLKEKITGLIKTVEKKYSDAYMVKNYERYIFCSNNDWIVKIESSDRRYCCLEASNQYAGNKSYFADLIKSCFNQECGTLFYNYLLNIDISGYHAGNIPMTSWKRNLMEGNLDDVIKTIIALIKDNYKNDDNLFLLKEFYQCYQTLKKNLYTTPQSFGHALSKYLPNIEKRTNAVKKDIKGVAYCVTIEELKNIVKNHIGDPNYEFIDTI